MKRTLYELSVGESGQMIGFADKNTEHTLRNFGLFIGRNATCIAKIGPIVVRSDLVVIALGKTLALRVYIK
ncbi:MAG: ferrous iron transport protein A [Holosporaceae bacterium]|jgi:hypothetical protein|nr:ferrous iron transport protein A [Holosporaceae bacterium]